MDCGGRRSTSLCDCLHHPRARVGQGERRPRFGWLVSCGVHVYLGRLFHTTETEKTEGPFPIRTREMSVMLFHVGEGFRTRVPLRPGLSVGALPFSVAAARWPGEGPSPPLP